MMALLLDAYNLKEVYTGTPVIALTNIVSAYIYAGKGVRKALE